MLEFYVTGQNLKMFSPVIAADSLNYLTAMFHFNGAEWDGYTRWAHFRKDSTVYDIALDENDMITEDKALNLTIGEWEIYVTGTNGSSRLTTVVVIVTVKKSGLEDAPLHVIPLSVAEQVDSKASQALLLAQAVKNAADEGKFNGKDGKGLEIKGFCESYEELVASVSEPNAGDAYGVGKEKPYEIYVWDGVNGEWVDNGQIQGAKGDKGDKGATFTPNVDANGNISWTNDGGLNNPATQNIRGATGATGATGAPGKSAYDAAEEAGYTGTEATFYGALTMMPYHNARHLPDGADPITVKIGNIDSAARTQYWTLDVGTTWEGDAAPYTQTVTANGMLATDRPKVYRVAPASVNDADAYDDEFSRLYKAESTAGGLKLYAKDKTTTAIKIAVEVSRI